VVNTRATLLRRANYYHGLYFESAVGFGLSQRIALTVLSAGKVRRTVHPVMEGP